MSKDTNVEFTITFVKGKLEELESSKGDYECNGLEKLLKLYTTNTTTNMHLFNAEDTLQKYNNIPDIINAYYEVRLKLYQERKIYMINALEKELLTLTNKAKYIVENLNGTIDLRKKKKEEVIQMLLDKGYDLLENDNDFKYLIKMPMDSVTEENVEKLLKDKINKECDLTVIKNTTINQMWLNELNQLKEMYLEYKKERTRLMDGIEVENIKINKKVVSKGVIKKQTKKSESKLLLVEDD
jgi:DNA topoisomerase-2